MEILSFFPFIVSFFVILLAMPWWIKKAKMVGLVWKDFNKFSEKMVAGGGGLIVIFGFLIGILFFIMIRIFWYSDTSTSLQLMAIITSILIISIIGFIDDLLVKRSGDLYVGFKQWQKPLLTLIAALPIVVINAGVSQINIPLFGLVDLMLFYPFLIVPVFIVVASNAFNLIAGYNGLEAGMGIIMTFTLGFLAWTNGLGWLAVVAFCMGFSLLAFYFFNRVPAKVFPGDILTYSVGALLGILGIIGNMEGAVIILFIPYGFEFFLKLRGKLKKQSYALPNENGTIIPRYKKVYGVEHFMHRFLIKLGIRVTEKRLVWSILIIEILLAFIVLLIYA